MGVCPGAHRAALTAAGRTPSAEGRAQDYVLNSDLLPATLPTRPNTWYASPRPQPISPFSHDKARPQLTGSRLHTCEPSPGGRLRQNHRLRLRRLSHRGFHLWLALARRQDIGRQCLALRQQLLHLHASSPGRCPVGPVPCRLDSRESTGAAEPWPESYRMTPRRFAAKLLIPRMHKIWRTTACLTSPCCALVIVQTRRKYAQSPRAGPLRTYPTEWHRVLAGLQQSVSVRCAVTQFRSYRARRSGPECLRR